MKKRKGKTKIRRKTTMKTKAKKTMKKIKNEDTYLKAKITTDKCIRT